MKILLAGLLATSLIISLKCKETQAQERSDIPKAEFIEQLDNIPPTYTGYCVVADKRNPTLNVRKTPGGQIINQLKNGRIVYIKQGSGKQITVGHDIHGQILRQEWSYVEGWYRGQWRKWGWVESLYLNCPD